MIKKNQRQNQSYKNNLTDLTAHVNNSLSTNISKKNTNYLHSKQNSIADSKLPQRKHRLSQHHAKLQVYKQAEDLLREKYCKNKVKENFPKYKPFQNDETHKNDDKRLINIDILNKKINHILKQFNNKKVQSNRKQSYQYFDNYNLNNNHDQNISKNELLKYRSKSYGNFKLNFNQKQINKNQRIQTEQNQLTFTFVPQKQGQINQRKDFNSIQDQLNEQIKQQSKRNSHSYDYYFDFRNFNNDSQRQRQSIIQERYYNIINRQNRQNQHQSLSLNKLLLCQRNFQKKSNIEYPIFQKISKAQQYCQFTDKFQQSIQQPSISSKKFSEQLKIVSKKFSKNIAFQRFTKSLISQISLDRNFIQSKKWFKVNESQQKWEQLFQCLYQREDELPYISQERIKQKFKIEEEQINPFTTIKGKYYDFNIVVDTYLKSQKYWSQKIIHSFSQEELHTQQISDLLRNPEKTSQQIYAEITVQDLVRYINLRTEGHYRNRDLILIYTRLKGSKTYLNFNRIIEMLCI